MNQTLTPDRERLLIQRALELTIEHHSAQLEKASSRKRPNIIDIDMRKLILKEYRDLLAKRMQP